MAQVYKSLNDVMNRLDLIHADGDGSCFFNALYMSIQQTSDLDKQFVRGLRKNIADLLTPERYNKIGNGALAELAKLGDDCKQYQRDNMMREIAGTGSVDFYIFEYVANLLDKDIFIIERKKAGILIPQVTYQLVCLGDYETFYKNRDSIILAYVGDGEHGHYDFYRRKDGISFFSPNDPMIVHLKETLVTMSK